MKILIIGGGIAGCSAAYYLSRDGHDVSLFERDSVASHASGFALGGIIPSFGDLPNNSYEVLSNYSIGLHRDLAEQLAGGNAENLNLLKKASVILAKEQSDLEDMQKIYEAHAKDYATDIRWLSTGELSHVEARISPDVLGGLYVGEAYEVDPYKLTLNLWQAAEQHGAKLVNRDVTDIVVESGRVSGVLAGADQFAAESIVVAAGPWSASLLLNLGINVPVTPLRGQILRLDAPDPPVRVSLWWDTDYATIKSDGLLWVGTTEEEVGFDDRTTSAARDRIIGSAVEILPYLSDAKLVQQTACLRPMTPDRLPIIEAVSGLEGLVIITGGGRNGILLGPSMGLAAANLVAGSDFPVDIRAFSLSRFA
tara:strand:- start:495 stop:1595 length:1101 start_codon:yes stop_codon:yes gene_type:complete